MRIESEQMKEIKDFPGYFIAEDGKVYSAKKRTGVKGKGKGLITYLDYKNLKELKLLIDSTNYYKVRLFKDNLGYCKSVHRLVAENFIPNPDNLPQVNHIDENKLNNHVSNLEWVTHKQNLQHSKCRYIWTVQNTITKEQTEVVNLTEFCREMSINCGSLYNTLGNKNWTHKNYKIISKIKFK